MPGIDRSRIVGKSAEELNEFTCGICRDVFSQPMVTPCRHTFCKECIEEWLSGHNTCPNDRKPLTRPGLYEAPHCFTNIIARMQIKCRLSDRGCPSVHSVDHDSTHMTVCPFVACRRCGLNNPGPSHDCVVHLMQKNLNLTEDINELRTENANLKTSNSDLMSTSMAVKEENKRFMQKNIKLTEDVIKLRKDKAIFKRSYRDLMSSQMALHKENKRFKTELDSKRDELKTLNEKVIQLEREKSIIDINCAIMEAKGKTGSVEEIVKIHQKWGKIFLCICRDAIKQFDSSKQTYNDFINWIKTKIDKVPSKMNVFYSWTVSVYANEVEVLEKNNYFIRISFGKLFIVISWQSSKPRVNSE